MVRKQPKLIKPGSIVRGIASPDQLVFAKTHDLGISKMIAAWDNETGQMLPIPIGTIGFVAAVIDDQRPGYYDVCWPSVVGIGTTTRADGESLEVLWSPPE